MGYYTEEELQEFGFHKLGKNVRISKKSSIYLPHMISIGDNVRIDDFCILSGNVTLGNYVFLGVFCNLAGGEAGIIIDDFVTLSYGVHVFSQSDDYSGNSMTSPMIPSKYKLEIKKMIEIKSYTIIGAGSIVMPGVVINEGCSIGSMSLVTKSTNPWHIYFGIPAKIKGIKSNKILEITKQYIEDSR